MSESRKVLIPLALGQDGRVGTVEAMTVRSHLQGQGLDPAIADLADCALYRAGLEARAAVRRLTGRKRYGLRLLPSASPNVQLTPSSPAEFKGLAEENNQSAELGLALGLLMANGRSPVPAILATGRLSGEDREDLSQIEVLPVDGIEQKCRGIAAFFEAHRGGPWSDGILFVTPDRAVNGQAFSQAHADALADLDAQAAKIGVRLTHQPVRTLAQAADLLHLRAAPKHPMEWPARVASVAGVAALALAGVVYSWANSPITLSFQPIEAEGQMLPSPLRSAFRADLQASAQLPLCRGADGLAQISWGEELTFLMSTEPTRAPSTWLDFVVIVVGEQSEPFVVPAQALPVGGRPERADDGSITLGARLPVVKGPDEEMKLVVLASKWSGLRVREIEDRLTEIHRDPEEREPINAYVAYLSRVADGYLDYSFKIQERLEGCSNNGV